AGLQQIVPRIRCAKPRLVELALVVRAREGGPEPEQGLPLPIDVGRVPGKVIPAAIPCPEFLRQVIKVDELALIEVRGTAAHDHNVVTCVRLDLRRQLRGDLWTGYGIYCDF